MPLPVPVRSEQVAQKQSSGTGTRRKAEPTELQTLNFKVPDDFKRAYKGYAATQGMTMLELLKEGFHLSKRKRERSR
jgi:hypothetical protein